MCNSKRSGRVSDAQVREDSVLHVDAQRAFCRLPEFSEALSAEVVGCTGGSGNPAIAHRFGETVEFGSGDFSAGLAESLLFGEVGVPISLKFSAQQIGIQVGDLQLSVFQV